MAKGKLDTKAALAAADRKDRGYYSRLGPEEQKALAGYFYMLQRSMSSTKKQAEHHMFFTNLFVNRGFLADTGITRHPELMWLSFCAVGTGQTQFHPYVKPPGGKKKRNRVHDFVSSCHPDWKADDVELFCTLNDADSLKQFARDHGLDDKQIREIFQ